jgi:translin
MKDISVTVASVNRRMDTLEAMRERSIAASRSVIRLTKRAIHAVHAHEEFENIIERAVSEFGTLHTAIGNEADIITSGPVCDAMMELSEACILSAIVTKADIPSFGAIGVTPQAWALGLADCLGEMRRIVLDRLMDGNMDEAKEMFADMDIVYEAVMSFDVPDAILPIRRKQDVARSVMERTRTDIANALLTYGRSKN